MFGAFCSQPIDKTEAVKAAGVKPAAMSACCLVCECEISAVLPSFPCRRAFIVGIGFVGFCCSNRCFERDSRLRGNDGVGCFRFAGWMLLVMGSVNALGRLKTDFRRPCFFAGEACAMGGGMAEMPILRDLRRDLWPRWIRQMPKGRLKAGLAVYPCAFRRPDGLFTGS